MNRRQVTSEFIKFSDDLDCVELLRQARQRGYTKEGEMFSAHQLAKLATDYYKCQADVTSFSPENPKEIVSGLLDQDMYVIPYDRDKNNEPCLMGGHQAHWAVLTGENSLGYIILFIF